MPEDNFEQQARRKADGFSMEPKPEVWQRVEAAIAPERRRRRVMLWWWLLPLCMGGMVAAILVGARKGIFTNTNDEVALTSNKRSAIDSLILNGKKTLKVQRTDTGTSSKEKAEVDSRSKKTLPRELNKREKRLVEKKRSVSEKVISFNLSGGEKNEEAVIDNDTLLQPTSHRAKIKDEGKVTVNNDLPTLDNSLENEKELVRKDSISKSKKSLSDSASLTIKDSAFGKAIAENKVKVEPAGRKWQIGILSEIGLASWDKGLLDNNKNLANNYLGTVGNDNAGNDSLGNGNISRQTRNGVNAALGIAFQKNLSRRFYFSIQFGYRYQQYHVSQFMSILIPQQNMNLTSYLVNSDDYHTHFLNLNASIGTRLFAVKRITGQTEAGVDNSLLLVMKQQDKIASTALSTRHTVTNNFYRWQPHFVMSFPFVLWKENKIGLQVSPLARFGLRYFEKNSNVHTNNRLMSAGVQVIYFF